MLQFLVSPFEIIILVSIYSVKYYIKSIVPFTVPCTILKGSRAFASKRDQWWPCNDRGMWIIVYCKGTTVKGTIQIRLQKYDYRKKWFNDYHSLFISCITYRIYFNLLIRMSYIYREIWFDSDVFIIYEEFHARTV